MLNKMRRNKKGFTLIELIIVVAILAILAAIAVPNFMNARKQGQWGVIMSDASSVAHVMNTNNALYPESLYEHPLSAANANAVAAELSGSCGAKVAILASSVLTYDDDTEMWYVSTTTLDEDIITSYTAANGSASES